MSVQVRLGALMPAEGPPDLPSHRWSVPPSELRALADDEAPFVAEIGVGIVHHSQPAPSPTVDPVVRSLHDRIKHEFDPTGRLNPGLDVLCGA
jgi:glycolate oxidase FAD binding subunit